MQLGMIGLGRMGSNMVQRLPGAGHECVVYDAHPQPMHELVSKGAKSATA
jgi:6-phosphogluconate dehydrogenase